jgi:hypothetical protein
MDVTFSYPTTLLEGLQKTVGAPVKHLWTRDFERNCKNAKFSNTAIWTTNIDHSGKCYNATDLKSLT